jgi:hypothetical protein
VAKWYIACTKNAAPSSEEEILMRRIGVLCLLTTVVLIGAPAATHATIIELTASMDCAQANAGAGTCGAGGSGTGTASITLNDQTNHLSWNISWSGLSGVTTVAHFHGPALPNQNAGVQVGITTSSPSIGSTDIAAQQAADLLAGLWYINIHTDSFPGGEIRGQVTVIPEPGTILLLVGGLTALVAFRRHRTH